MSQPHARTFAAALLVCAGCYVGASFASWVRFPGVGTAILFPPYAILAAALLRAPPRRWWIWLLASSTGNIWAHANASEPLSFALLAELANVARALVAVAGIRRFAGGVKGVFESLQGMSVFLLFAGVIGPLVGATLGAGAVLLHHRAAIYWFPWQAWMLSNTLTGLTLLPIALIPLSRPVLPRRSRLLEGMVLLLALAGVSGLIFFEPSRGHGASPVSLYLPLPLLLWASIRFGPLGTSSSLLLVSGMAIAGTLVGRGPLVGGPPDSQLLELQAFLLSVSIPLLLLAALLREQRRTAEALQASQLQYQTVVEDQSEMICRFGSDGAVSFVNDAFCRRMRRSRQELLGQSFVCLMPPDQQTRVSQLLVGLAPDRREAAWEQEAPGDVGPSSERWRVCAFFDGQPRLIDHQAVGRDITERKRAEEEHRLLVAQQARADVLQEADRRKDEFIAMLAHELRNPLSPITLAVEILRRQPAADEQVVWARDVIGRQVNQLSHLVDDLLDVSRIRWGTFQLQKKPVDLAEVVTTAVETSRAQIESRMLDLAVRMAEGSLQVSGDATRLAQLVSNLLNNAAKFSPLGGRVDLSVARSDSEIVLSVRDDGVGISPEMINRVFEPFVQADRPRDSALGGLGLGLTLVKRLAEMHGGRAEARSEGPGRGSEFLVRLPALTLDSGESSSGRGAREPGELCLAGRRVLVVDDAPDSAESLAQFLALLGCEVQVVNDGQAGLAAVEQTPPEIVFLDLRMPGMSGLDVARQLRRGQGANRMVLVATTGDGQPEDRRQTTEAGFDYHLTKPMDIGQLLAIISADRE